MRKIIIALLAAVIPVTMASCSVTHKDYSSNTSGAESTATQSIGTSSEEVYDTDKIIGYDIYRPGQGDTSSEATSDRENGNTSATSDATVSGGTNSSASSSAASSNAASSRASSSDSSSKTSSSTSSSSSSKTSSDKSSDSTSSYYDDWEGDNVIDFSDLINGNIGG